MSMKTKVISDFKYFHEFIATFFLEKLEKKVTHLVLFMVAFVNKKKSFIVKFTISIALCLAQMECL